MSIDILVKERAGFRLLAGEREEAEKRFQLFNELGGKFRVAILNVCNLDCFFCHNEAMPNPRQEKDAPADVLHFNDMLGIMNAYTALGGKQLNITGGEPLAHPRLFELLEKIEKRETRIVLNSNVVLGERLLKRPLNDKIDGILASLHTIDNELFQEKLGGRDVQRVIDNIIALHKYGYKVQMNFSLGPYNLEQFPRVLDLAIEEQISLKAITLVRPNESPDFYGGMWVDPDWLTGHLEQRGGELVSCNDAIGGQKMIWRVGGTKIEVKNIARGRLRTDYCNGCAHTKSCGEGIYGMRVGVDGFWKPCLLRHDQYRPVMQTDSYAEQILAGISAMVGEWENARYLTGAPA